MAARRRKKSKVPTDRPRPAPKVYIETSVWGMTLDDQPRALRETTRQFLRQCSSGLFVTYISTVVVQNHRHMANERKRSLFAAVNRLAGYKQELRIHTPVEMIQ
jgi:hypothetical protein